MTIRNSDISIPKSDGRRTWLYAVYFILFTAALLLTSYFLIPAISLAAEADDPITKIQKAYEGIKDISGSFVQKSYIKDLKRTDTYKGRLFIKPPMLKWEYSGEKAQTIYVNNEYVMIYQKRENQVFRSRFDRATYGQAPIALLAGLGDIRKEFDVVSATPQLIVLRPLNAMGNIVRIEITPSDSGFPIKVLKIVDSLSNRVEIALKDMQTNTGLADELFRFVPPKNAAILEN